MSRERYILVERVFNGQAGITFYSRAHIQSSISVLDGPDLAWYAKWQCMGRERERRKQRISIWAVEYNFRRSKNTIQMTRIQRPRDTHLVPKFFFILMATLFGLVCQMPMHWESCSPGPPIPMYFFPLSFVCPVCIYRYTYILIQYK